MRHMRLNTIPKMSARLQRSPASIESAIDRLGVKPALELNGLRYYAVEDETRIREQLLAAEEIAAWDAPAINE